LIGFRFIAMPATGAGRSLSVDRLAMKTPTRFTRGNISDNIMTPLIDVVFQLLIFFVCAAALGAHELLLPADLASAGGVKAELAPANPDEPANDEVWIALSVDGRGQTIMELNGTRYASLDQLAAVLGQLAEIAPESPVVLDIAGDVQAGAMIGVYDACRQAGFQSINFKAPDPR